MNAEGQKLVCGKCGSWFIPGVTGEGRRLVATGIIANRMSGRSLKLSVTAAGVTGSLALGGRP
jgi:hypothetical protein